MMKKAGSTIRLLFTVLPVAAAVVLAGCGSAAVDSSAPSRAAVTASDQPAPVASPTADVMGAEQAALALFVKLPLNSTDPSAGYVWTSGPSSLSHLSPVVKTRLAELSSQGYFSDAGGCGENYITATQNGLFAAPAVLSSAAGANGSVTVTIQRGPNAPVLTAVMTDETGSWLASDLQSGTGPNASIFAAKPNC